MAEQNKKQDDNPLGGIAVVVGIICAIAGFAKGGWLLALVAFFIGAGAVFLAARILGVFIGWLLTGIVLLGMAAIFMNRWDWLYNTLFR